MSARRSPRWSPRCSRRSPGRAECASREQTQNRTAPARRVRFCVCLPVDFLGAEATRQPDLALLAHGYRCRGRRCGAGGGRA
ncbi:hypothetical protein FVP45_06475 [Mycobacterium tuberculosis]|nr:hypothetical protein [Mycobacterium tuberculosis]NKE40028.1 hypothetical protein [Mycobacterium tuberculosis]